MPKRPVGVIRLAKYDDLEDLVYQGFIIDDSEKREKGITFHLTTRDGLGKKQLKISYRSLNAYQDMLGDLVVASKEPLGKERIWWCLRCEIAFRQAERPKLGQQCPECQNRGSIHKWARDEWPRSANPAYPEIPELGKLYPLYPERSMGQARVGKPERLRLLAKVEEMMSDGLRELEYWVSTGEPGALKVAQIQFMSIWEKTIQDEIRECLFASGATLLQTPGK